jgi:hypothetical protein
LKKNTAKFAQLHSSYAANLYVHAGWVVRKEFRDRDDEEPYEYILEGIRDGDPIRPDLSKKYASTSTRGPRP